MNVDPNGAYFFGLIGSTSEQRSAASAFAARTGGTVIDGHRKRIFVAYKEQVSFGELPMIVQREQGFELDGTLSHQGPMLGVPVNDMWDNWAESENLLGSMTYDVADKAYLAFQGSPFGAPFFPPSHRKHIEGSHASQSDVERGFFETAASIVPAGRGGGMLSKLNAAQFSKTFKGNLARMSAKSRGMINRALNYGIEKFNSAKWLLKPAAFKAGDAASEDEQPEAPATNSDD